MEGWKVIADKMKNSTTTKAYTKTEEFQNYFKIEKINYISYLARDWKGHVYTGEVITTKYCNAPRESADDDTATLDYLRGT